MQTRLPHPTLQTPPVINKTIKETIYLARMRLFILSNGGWFLHRLLSVDKGYAVKRSINPI